MEGETSRKRLREEGTCSVCLDYFREPVTLDCGHNFCQACITKCWGDAPTDASCPQCRERVQPSNLRLNRQLGSLVQLVKELGEPPRQGEARGHICGRHQEPLKLFCQEDQAPICVVCVRAKEHRAHCVIPQEEAALEVKDQLSRSLEILRKERENILLFKAENEKESQDLLIGMEEEREKTVAVFRQLHQFLEEQEKLLLAQTEEVEKEITRSRDKHLARLSKELSSLDSLIQELEEKQQQSVSELLQNIGNILKRCQKESFENPVAFPVSLKWRIHDFYDISFFLEGFMKQFKDSLISGFLLQEANVTLDPDTAHFQLILSKNCKSVRKGNKFQLVLKNPKRFVNWPFVLGRERFTTGRYCWEVTVGSEEKWAVGVARKSVKRKDTFDLGPGEGIWAVGKWKGKCRILSAPYTPLPLSQKLKRIRVILNYAGGRVAFFDVNTGAQLYVYKEASFCGEALFPFFYVTGKAYLSLLP